MGSSRTFVHSENSKEHDFVFLQGTVVLNVLILFYKATENFRKPFISYGLAWNISDYNV